MRQKMNTTAAFGLTYNELLLVGLAMGSVGTNLGGHGWEHLKELQTWTSVFMGLGATILAFVTGKTSGSTSQYQLSAAVMDALRKEQELRNGQATRNAVVRDDRDNHQRDPDN